jgi:hypothetical protein
MPEVMNQPTQIATSSMPGFRAVVASVPVGRGRFMLIAPEPATPLPEDVADREALRAALNDSRPRIPYDQLRRELGL